METRLNSKQQFRVTTGHSKNNFIDIKSGEWEQALEVSFLTSKQYMEGRKTALCVHFILKVKDTKKTMTLGGGKMQKLFLRIMTYNTSNLIVVIPCCVLVLMEYNGLAMKR